VETGVDAAEALRRTSALGGFFAVDLEPEGPVWQPFSVLLRSDGSALRAEVGALRSRLAARAGVALDDVAGRVAASVWFLGWSNRLISPWLGAEAVAGVVPVVSADDLLWRPAPAQPVPLAVRELAGVGPTGEGLSGEADLYAACVASLVQPLLMATAAAYPVSRRLLWGNVASAAAGAATVVAGSSPAQAVAARAALDRLLTTGDLVGQGEWRGPQFVRRSCCLMYRLPDAGLCGDCVLAHR
jgi:hypothetical protein